LTHRAAGAAALCEESSMLYWAVIFFIVAIIAGVLGFGRVSEAATGIAKILFIIFLILFVLSLIFYGTGTSLWGTP
jgi:uncharacterized membrane protein YtjA (UPF0391 family)